MVGRPEADKGTAGATAGPCRGADRSEYARWCRRSSSPACAGRNVDVDNRGRNEGGAGDGTGEGNASLRNAYGWGGGRKVELAALPPEVKGRRPWCERQRPEPEANCRSDAGGVNLFAQNSPRAEDARMHSRPHRYQTGRKPSLDQRKWHDAAYVAERTWPVGYSTDRQNVLLQGKTPQHQGRSATRYAQ